ncbi:MAG: glycosyltransferase, partial [Candidatus Paceibacterota bacterium]
QPNKLFEYMHAGLPVIASDFPLWREIIEGNNCGLLVNPLNPNEIAEAILWLYNNPDKAREMGRNGQKAVKEKYNWEQEEKKLLQLYETIAEN